MARIIEFLKEEKNSKFFLLFFLIIPFLFLTVTQYSEMKNNEFSIAPTQAEIFGQEEDLYFVVFHTSIEPSINFVSELMDLKESTRLESDEQGNLVGTSDFSKEPFEKNGLFYEFDSSKKAFYANVGFYVVHMENYPSAIEQLEIQGFPEYLVIKTESEFSGSEVSLEDKIENRSLIYMSFGKKTNEQLLNEFRYINHYGLPSNLDNIRTIDEEIAYTFDGSFQEEKTENGFIYSFNLSMSSLLEDSAHLDLDNFKVQTIHDKDSYDLEKEWLYREGYEDSSVVELEGGVINNEITLYFEIEEDVETIVLVYGDYDEELERFPIELRIRIK